MSKLHSIIHSLNRSGGLFLLGLVSSLSITAIVYWPGISGPFLFDDIPNLSELGKFEGITNFETFRHFVFGNVSGPTGRPVAMLSFLLDSREWPASPESFKTTNILIHLMCGLAICWFVYLLCQHLSKSKTASAQIALVVMAIWLLHPLNVSTTLYVVQRMTQLMTLFAILSLVFYLLGRKIIETNPKQSMLFLCICLFPFALLSVLSKESGALLLLIIIISESLLFSSHSSTRQFRLWYRCGVLLPLSIVASYLIVTAPESLAFYEFRNFSLGERLLTEGRIVSEFILKIFLPDQQLGILLHDGYQISTSLLNPVSTLFSILFLFGLCIAAIYFRHKQPVFSFAVFWFFTMHLLESTYIPLELYFEHRNYMAMIGPLFAAIWYLHSLFVSEASDLIKYSMKIFVASVLALSLWLTSQLAHIWSDSLELYSHMAIQRPNSSRAQLSYAEALQTEGQNQQVFERLYANIQNHPNDLVSLLAIWNYSCRQQLDEPLPISAIAEMTGLELSNENINIYMDQLIAYAQSNTCQQIDAEALVRLFERIGSFPIRAVHKSNYYYSFSNLYLLLQQPNNALDMLERASEYNETVDLRNWQALVAAGVDQWERSIGFIELSKQVDERRSLLVPSRLLDIEQLEALIVSQSSESSDIENIPQTN
ncbi:MAG: hypothetical protein GKR91_20335 [Pseudomonadales bacterium]|nr:hypothetical protein [Pseudomonadales bacterium]